MKWGCLGLFHAEISGVILEYLQLADGAAHFVERMK